MGAGNGLVGVVDGRTGTLLRMLEPPSPAPTFSGVIVANGMVYWVSGGTLNGWGPP
jgi:hypothetical protein